MRESLYLQLSVWILSRGHALENIYLNKHISSDRGMRAQGRISQAKLILLLTALICICFSFAAMAAPYDDPSSGGVPFELEFDTLGCDRLCYAGHESSGVKYETGYAVTPTTAFRLKVKEGASSASTGDLSISISLIYENDDRTAAMRETIKSYEMGDIEDTDTYYPIFDEINVENLAERDRLYNDSLSSIEVSMNYKGLRGKASEQRLYLQVVSDEELRDLVSGAGA